MNRLLLFIGVAFLLGCTSQDENVAPKAGYIVEAPSNLGEVPFQARNPFSKKKIELGRMLFYDPILSGNK